MLHQIGAGTLGPVFRAYDATRERLVAVKLFKLDLPPERTHQLVAELERLIAADLTHPSLAAPLATGISGVSAFLAQDYVAADSLDLAVREYGPAPPGSALQVAAQLAGALDFAAAVQILHGSLHPRDVLLSSDDTRLTGLGVTTALERIGVVAPVRRPYSAPERIAGGGWDRRADVFSLAALMHELLWGRRVSGLGARAADNLTEIVGADLAALQDVFARALAEKPDERYGTALAFAEALKNACPDVAVMPEAAVAGKRRAARGDEPRLPLDEAAPEQATTVDSPVPGPAAAPATDAGERRASAKRERQRNRPAAPAVEPNAPPATAVAEDAGLSHDEPPGELPLVTATRDPRQDRSAADLEMPIPLSASAEPDIAYRPAARLVAEPSLAEPVISSPPGFITGRDLDSSSALERTRSAVWPLVLALVVGIAIGFAGGFFAGSRQEPPPAAVATTAPESAPTAPAREFTEGAVAAPPSSTPAAAKSEVRSQKPEVEAKKADSNPKSEISTPKSQAAEGRLLVRSSPAGAHVSVDGKDYGSTPATVRNLTRGAHRVKITRDGYASQERRVVVTASRPAQSMSVALVPVRAAAPTRAQTPVATHGGFVGALAVDSRPTGAKVFMDGELVGTTPMALPSVSAGSHAIRLEHDGYRRWSSSVRIVASEQNRVTASLER